MHQHGPACGCGHDHHHPPPLMPYDWCWCTDCGRFFQVEDLLIQGMMEKGPGSKDRCPYQDCKSLEFIEYREIVLNYPQAAPPTMRNLSKGQKWQP